MWSLGCILAEMLLEKPIFPGPSSVQQLQLISQTLPAPSKEDMKIFAGSFGQTLLSRSPNGKRTSLDEILRKAPSDAVDLVKKLLVLNPLKRLSAAEAIKHTYVAKFLTVDSFEPSPGCPVAPPLDDNVLLTVDKYRSTLYKLADAETPKPLKMGQRPLVKDEVVLTKKTAVAPVKASRDQQVKTRPLQKKESGDQGVGEKVGVKRVERKSTLPVWNGSRKCPAASGLAQKRQPLVKKKL